MDGHRCKLDLYIFVFGVCDFSRDLVLRFRDFLARRRIMGNEDRKEISKGGVALWRFRGEWSK